MVLEIFRILIYVLDNLWVAIMPANYEWIGTVTSFCALAVTYIPRIKLFISYVMYFIPLQVLLPIIYVVVFLICARIVMACIRVITDLL